MSEQDAPEPKETRAPLTITLPVTMLRRLQPLGVQRTRSYFVEAAIAAALDQADQDREVKAAS
jgi:hypothetical protein